MTALNRFLFVSPYYVPFVGGTTAFIEAMSRRWVASGHCATVLTTTAQHATDFWQSPTGPLLPASETLEGVMIERLHFVYPPPAPYTFGLLRRAGHWLHRSGLPAAVQRPLSRRLARAMPPLSGLRDALARLVPDADLVEVEDSSWDGLFTAAVDAAQSHGKPVVVKPLMHLGDAGVRAHFQMAHQVDAYRSADAVLALSQREKAEYIRLGVAESRIHMIAMGIDSRDRHDTTGAAAAFRDRHNLQGPIVAFLGANTFDKGAFTLALAAAHLSTTGVPVRVVFAGPGSERLAAFVAQQPREVQDTLKEHIRILGLVDEATKHGLLATCNLLALPSQVDTFGIVLLEAWSYGKPVIGARAGGIPDLVHDEQDGLLVPFGDATALADAIRQLVLTPGLAARLGEAGRERVRQDFTWDRTYRTLLGVYDIVMETTIDTHAHRLHRP